MVDHSNAGHAHQKCCDAKEMLFDLCLQAALWLQFDIEAIDKGCRRLDRKASKPTASVEMEQLLEVWHRPSTR